MCSVGGKPGPLDASEVYGRIQRESTAFPRCRSVGLTEPIARHRNSINTVAGRFAGGLVADCRPSCRHAATRLYHRNFSWKRKVRPSFRVLLIWPKLGEVMVLPGSANCGVLKKLMDSARNSIVHSPPTGKRR